MLLIFLSNLWQLISFGRNKVPSYLSRILFLYLSAWHVDRNNCKCTNLAEYILIN